VTILAVLSFSYYELWSVGQLIGILVGFVIGGVLAGIGKWRLAFFFTGIPGLFLAFLPEAA
jgi:MFS family permease